MSGLGELRVSLTKNGYYKVADVLKRHPRGEVLDNISGQYEGINLDRAQILNMLSGNESTGELPDEWDEVRVLGDRPVEVLTFIAILFSHEDLIRSFAAASTGEMRGTITREALGQKAYTNLVYSMETAGLCVLRRGDDSTTYNFAPLFELSIGPLIKKVIRRKLEKTGWREPGPNEIFKRDFYEQCFFFEFHKALGISERQFRDCLEGEVVEIEAPPDAVFLDAAVAVSASLVAALSAKPFVIVAGTAGTGKTRTVRECVHRLCPDGLSKSFNHVFIPVEAGWTDGRHLLGYRNPFGKSGETYAATPLISLLLKANHPNHAHVPFFVILDEMNLSHVEMYFSRFLSLMETTAAGSPEPVLGFNELELLLRSGLTAIEAAYVEQALSSGGVYLTPNVMIIGTVNVDETTCMFSPKVLDRAFVLEFPTAKPSETPVEFMLPANDTSRECAAYFAERLVRREKPANRDVLGFLDRVYDKLGAFRFGPRVTQEVQRYAAAVADLASSCDPSFVDNAHLKDRILMQKILPKIHGNRVQLSPILGELIGIAVNEGCSRSADRLKAMSRDLKSPGFTNFFA
ncbi:MAG: hypothetical protein HQ518_01465 [Rhodopirellula sp.]|nr:hypothetical protein [Rhodopirellula sp.]